MYVKKTGSFGMCVGRFGAVLTENQTVTTNVIKNQKANQTLLVWFEFKKCGFGFKTNENLKEF